MPIKYLTFQPFCIYFVNINKFEILTKEGRPSIILYNYD